MVRQKFAEYDQEIDELKNTKELYQKMFEEMAGRIDELTSKVSANGSEENTEMKDLQAQILNITNQPAKPTS